MGKSFSSFNFVRFADSANSSQNSIRYRINYSQTLELAHKINWEFLHNLPPDEAWATFTTTLKSLLRSSSVPIHTRPKSPPKSSTESSTISCNTNFQSMASEIRFGTGFPATSVNVRLQFMSAELPTPRPLSTVVSRRIGHRSHAISDLYK